MAVLCVPKWFLPVCGHAGRLVPGIRASVLRSFRAFLLGAISNTLPALSNNQRALSTQNAAKIRLTIH